MPKTTCSSTKSLKLRKNTPNLTKIRRLRGSLKKKGIDALLISNQINIRYLTGFPSSDSYLLTTGGHAWFITDARYYEQASLLLPNFKVELIEKTALRTIVKLASAENLKRLGFEANDLSVAGYRQLSRALLPIKSIPTFKLVEDLRMIKHAEEIKRIKTAVKITTKLLNQVKNIIRPGIREIEISTELEGLLRAGGAQGSSFEPIVASGKNSCFPHHLTSRRKLSKNDSLLIDIGAEYQGYKSDLTRMFFLGKIPSELRKIYEIVRQAQVRAINKIKPGIKICEVDKSARQHIVEHGYGGFFSHSLGHGIGLGIHEQPFISAKNTSRLKAGMLFTIEPAIYLPNTFGVRLEEDVLVTEQGCEVLSGNFHKPD